MKVVVVLLHGATLLSNLNLFSLCLYNMIILYGLCTVVGDTYVLNSECNNNSMFSYQNH